MPQSSEIAVIVSLANGLGSTRCFSDDANGRFVVGDMEGGSLDLNMVKNPVNYTKTDGVGRQAETAPQGVEWTHAHMTAVKDTVRPPSRTRKGQGKDTVEDIATTMLVGRTTNESATDEPSPRR